MRRLKMQQNGTSNFTLLALKKQHNFMTSLEKCLRMSLYMANCVGHFEVGYFAFSARDSFIFNFAVHL